jgi:hypothetical protein
MTTADEHFSTAVERAFLWLRQAPHTELPVRWGPIGCRLIVADETLGRHYSSSFLPVRGGDLAVSVAVLTSDNIELAEFTPLDPTKGRTYFSERCVVVWHPDPLPVLYILDRAANTGVVWLSGGRAPEWELSRPACPLLHSFLNDTPWSAIHSAAAGQNGRLLLLAGKGRAGKSTAALACARAGWDYAGDDFVCVDTQSGRVEPLYTSARLRADMAGAFTDMLHMSTGTSNDHGDVRHELRLTDYLRPDRWRGGDLAAILIPRRQGARLPEWVEATRGEALQALYMQTALAMPGPPRIVGRKLSRLAGLAPAYFVDTGNDPTAIPGAFAELLDRL